MTEVERASQRRAAAKVLLQGLLASVVTASLCNLLLDLSQTIKLGAPGVDLATTARLFLTSVALVWPAVVLAIAITGRLWHGIGAITALTALLAFVHRQKLNYRLEPLFPSDLSFAKEIGFFGETLGYSTILQGLSLALATLGVPVLIGRLRDKNPNARIGKTRTTNLLLRVTASICCVSALAYTTTFSSPSNRVRMFVEAQGAHWNNWSQVKNYVDNGFVPAFLFNLSSVAMERPADYNRKNMLSLAMKYKRVADHVNAGREHGALMHTNIILVLAESFSDPTLIPGLSFKEDPLPFTRDLMTRVTSGPVLAQSYGGGTSNMEFAALTGHSIGTFNPQIKTPYQQLVPRLRPYPSVVGYLQTQGFRTVALHPSSPTLYRRSEVYESFGFDDFVSKADLAHSKALASGDFVSDDSAFKEVDDLIDECVDPVFVNLVTMQNHIPYNDRYPDAIPVEGTSSLSEASTVSNYARGLRHTDQALKAWLDRLSRSSEKTIVLFYGDHQPPVWSDEVRARAGGRRMHQTTMFVWKNYGEQKAQTLPTTSPIHFMNQVFDAADAPVPPYFALLRELEREVPGMEGPVMVGPDDEPMRPEELNSHARALLHDYRLVQYDFSVGGRYAVHDMFYSLDNPSVQAAD